MGETWHVIRSCALALAALPLLAGCASDRASAMVACETFVNERVGAELEHRSPMDGAVVEGDGPYVVHSAYVEPLTRRTTSYTCTVEPAEDGWHLIDLTVSR